MKLVIKMTGLGANSYRAWCPALPGCSVFGQSKEEAQDKIRHAVEGYLASLDVALPRELSRKFRTESVCVG